MGNWDRLVDDGPLCVSVRRLHLQTKQTNIDSIWIVYRLFPFLLLLSEDNIATMSTFYVLGLGIAMVVLFTSRLISDESEIIG